MRMVPYDIWIQYDDFLKANLADVYQHADFKKWLSIPK
jgi:hypothetical protein